MKLLPLIIGVLFLRDVTVYGVIKFSNDGILTCRVKGDGSSHDVLHCTLFLLFFC